MVPATRDRAEVALAMSASHLSDLAAEVAQRLRTVFAVLDDLKSQTEREYLYSVVVRHVRSAQPMALLGAADVIEPTAEVIVPLQDGARIDLNVDDGSLVLYVVEPSGKDAAVALSVGRTEDLRRGLSRILASAGVR